MKVAVLELVSGLTLVGFVEDPDAPWCQLQGGGEDEAATVIRLHYPAKVKFDMGQVDNPIDPRGERGGHVVPIAFPIPMQVPHLWLDLEDVIMGDVFDADEPSAPSDGQPAALDQRAPLVRSYLLVLGNVVPATGPGRPKGRTKIVRGG